MTPGAAASASHLVLFAQLRVLSSNSVWERKSETWHKSITHGVRPKGWISQACLKVHGIGIILCLKEVQPYDLASFTARTVYGSSDSCWLNRNMYLSTYMYIYIYISYIGIVIKIRICIYIYICIHIIGVRRKSRTGRS